MLNLMPSRLRINKLILYLDIIYHKFMNIKICLKGNKTKRQLKKPDPVLCLKYKCTVLLFCVIFNFIQISIYLSEACVLEVLNVFTRDWPVHLQSINQSIKQSTNQSNNSSINQSINISTNKPINQSIYQPTNQPVNQYINQLISQSIY